MTGAHRPIRAANSGKEPGATSVAPSRNRARSMLNKRSADGLDGSPRRVPRTDPPWCGRIPIRYPIEIRYGACFATLDEQGYCNIVGRLKDMVVRGLLRSACYRALSRSSMGEHRSVRHTSKRPSGSSSVGATCTAIVSASPHSHTEDAPGSIEHKHCIQSSHRWIQPPVLTPECGFRPPTKGPCATARPDPSSRRSRSSTMPNIPAGADSGICPKPTTSAPARPQPTKYPSTCTS